MVNFGVCQLDFQVTHSITEGNQWRSLKQKPIKQHWLLPAYGYLSHVAQAHLSREWPVHSGPFIMQSLCNQEMAYKGAHRPDWRGNSSIEGLSSRVCQAGNHGDPSYLSLKSRTIETVQSQCIHESYVWNKRSVRTDSMSQEVLSSWSAMKSLLSFSRYLCLLNPDKII